MKLLTGVEGKEVTFLFIDTQIVEESFLEDINSLLNSGYTSCQAFHEAMKLLIKINPNIKLSEISQKTFEIIYPIYNDYYENNIDNHSKN